MGSDMRRSSADGADWKWKEIIRAMATMPRYMERRSQERKVRSFAQWSRASEAAFSKRRAPRYGRVRKMWEFDSRCLFGVNKG
jgi:hypothetical protein